MQRSELQSRQERDTLGHQRMANRPPALRAVVAALLLFALIVPIVAAKLDTLWLSEFPFSLETTQPVCVPSGLCFRLAGDRLERNGSVHRVALRITGVDNVYQLAKDLDEGRLRAIVEGGGAISARLQPAYQLYINADEVVRESGAFLEFDRQPTGRVKVAFDHGGSASGYVTLDIRPTSVGRFGSFLAVAVDAKDVRLLVGVLILLIAAVSSAIEARACEHSSFRGAFASLLFLRLAAIVAAGTMASSMLQIGVVLAIVLPWLAILRAWQLRGDRHLGAADRLSATLTSLTARLWGSDGRMHRGRITVVELGVLALGLGLFAHMLWLGASFRWSVFEERDFLEARQVVSSWVFPLYGPELLMGGHTIGGTLYLLLAPVVALWNDPEALRLLNQLLFLGVPVLLWWALRDRVGPPGALFAVFAFIASERIVALSYWPIHPNFSIFFAFLYGAAVLRGSVDGRRGWLIFSGLLLGLLTQLHFSYFLLVPCHVLLVLFGNAAPGRGTRPLAIAAVLVPLVPFLLIDALQGFPNIAQIAERPRFHSLYPNKPFGNAGLPLLIFGWIRQVGGLLSGLLSQLTVVLIGLGFAIGIGSHMQARQLGRPRMTPAFAAAILFCLPLAGLTVLGMGYNSRHTIAVVPGLFMLAGIGFAGLVRLLHPPRAWIGTTAVLPLLLLVALRAADSTAMAKIVQSEGEWAVDYKSREAIAMDLAVRLGVSPEAYARRTFWWWVGWSIEPSMYARIYQRVVPPGAQRPALPDNQYVLITSEAELPPFLGVVFDVNSSRPVGGMHVHSATPRAKLGSVLPSSNADTGVRLHPFLQEVDLIRRRQEGFVRVAHQQHRSTRRDLFLGVLAQGRIKVLVATERTQVDGRGRLRWCVDSPSLNGHYQEFKTVWRPRLVLTPEREAPMHASLAADVLGSLPFKTPRCGETWSEKAGAWQASLALEGLFDQSFMARPDLTPREWPLDFTVALHTGLLPQQATMQWLGSRFGP